MSSRTYTNVSVMLEEDRIGTASNMGALPNDNRYKTILVDGSTGTPPVPQETFDTEIKGINPLGYMTGGQGQTEITITPVDDSAIPSNATIDEVSFDLQLWWAKNDIANAVQEVEISPFMSHRTEIAGPFTDTQTMLLGPVEVGEVPSFKTFAAESAAGVPPTWVVRWDSSGDVTPFQTKFGFLHTQAQGYGPVVVDNASVTIDFTLPEPSITDTARTEWTFDGMQGFGIEPDGSSPPAYGANIPAGTYTNGAVLAAALNTAFEIASAYAQTIWTYDSTTRRFRVVVNGFNFALLTDNFPVDGVSDVASMGFPQVRYTNDNLFGVTGDSVFPTFTVFENITPRSVVFRGVVNPNGATIAYPVSVYAEYWSDVDEAVSATDSISLIGTGEQTVALEMTNLLPGVTYNVQLIAENEDHTVRGAINIFTTPERDATL